MVYLSPFHIENNSCNQERRHPLLLLYLGIQNSLFYHCLLSDLPLSEKEAEIEFCCDTNLNAF